MITATLEEPAGLCQRKNRSDFELAGRFPARVEQLPPDAQVLNVFGDRQTADLGQVCPEDMQRHTADDAILVIHGDKKLANRFVELSHRSPDHQLLVGKHPNLFVDS
jgi:hypothetical protein